MAFYIEDKSFKQQKKGSKFRKSYNFCIKQNRNSEIRGDRCTKKTKTKKKEKNRTKNEIKIFTIVYRFASKKKEKK